MLHRSNCGLILNIEYRGVLWPDRLMDVHPHRAGIRILKPFLMRFWIPIPFRYDRVGQSSLGADMKRCIAALLGVLVLALSVESQAAQSWTQGKHYVLLSAVQPTTVSAGEVEVMEVFSYGCPACNRFQPVVEKLKASLPPNAQMVFLPASFNPTEDWPMLQRAYFAAQSLGIAERTHQGMYDAVWKTGELAVSDPVTHRLKYPQPSIEDAAKCYERMTGVKPEAFLAAAKSFAVDVKIRAADAQVAALQVPGTPCIVVNGKYRVNMDSLGSTDDLIDLVRYLVAQESAH
jgi:thiol:disulfide interchange protein DsbA